MKKLSDRVLDFLRPENLFMARTLWKIGLLFNQKLKGQQGDNVAALFGIRRACESSLTFLVCSTLSSFLFNWTGMKSPSR